MATKTTMAWILNVLVLTTGCLLSNAVGKNSAACSDGTNQKLDTLLMMMSRMEGELTELKRLGTTYKGCEDALQRGWNSSGVYRISPDGNTQMNVYCEQELDGGGWTVFQSRKDGSVDFNRNWASYKYGFGSLTDEFWLGNDNLHILTEREDQKLKIELKYNAETVYADYSVFWIEGERQKYRLHLGGFSGADPPGNSFMYHYNAMFSTKDRDNDISEKHRAQDYSSPWWHKFEPHSGLNGVYGSSEPCRNLLEDLER